MPKRVSLKGKGADIFFGEYPPPEEPSASSLSTPADQISAPSEQALEPVPASSGQQRQVADAPAAPSDEIKERAPMRARVHARTDASTGARVRTAMRDDLHKRLQTKQRLASYTFRFRPEELDELDKVVAELGRLMGQKPSKNDLVRLALLWLLADFRENNDASVLAQVLARM